MKSIKESVVSKDAVEKEGALLMSLTHPGLPHIFGICIDCKPYLIITQFHGFIEGDHCIPMTMVQCQDRELTWHLSELQRP